MYFVLIFLIKKSKEFGRNLNGHMGIFFFFLDLRRAERVGVGMVLKGLDQKCLFICHNCDLVGCSNPPPPPPPPATYSTSGSKLTLDWIKMRRVRNLLTQPFSRQEPQVFSISSLKLKAGKLIMETNSFILNMLYNLTLWALEMKRKRHFCSDLWWDVTS